MLARVTLLALLLAVTGCMPATLVSVQPVSLARPASAGEASLTRYTQRVLERSPTSGPVTSNAMRFGVAARAQRVDPEDRRLALAELALRAAVDVEDTAPVAARDRYLLAGAHASDALERLAATPMRAAFDGRVPLAREFYNVATGRLLRVLLPLDRTAGPVTIDIAGSRFELHFDEPETRRLLGQFDELQLAWTLDVAGLRTRFERDGLGVPVVGWRAAPAYDPEWRYGPDGHAAALTAWLEFDPPGMSPRHVRLMLRESRGGSARCLNGTQAPLAADFTAPLALAWSRSRAAELGRDGFRGRPEAQRARGFRLLEPYDPRRIPLILVHGLASSPQAWRNLTNEVLGAPELRERYQVWQYAYPTSEPFLVAAQRFRADLHELLEALGVGPGAGIVVVGHSMGGLLAKSLVVDSGAALWDAAFAVPAHDLQAPPETRRVLEETLVLHPWPEIGRVVFVATPHGGSELADRWWARIAEHLVEQPSSVRVQLRELVHEEPGQVRPALREWIVATRGTSVDALSPRQPLLQAFRALPIDGRVPFHTILGVATRDFAGRPGDGVVRAADARLPGAASETALPLRHGEFDTAIALDELRRILVEHADSRQAGPPPSEEPCPAGNRGA